MKNAFTRVAVALLLAVIPCRPSYGWSAPDEISVAGAHLDGSGKRKDSNFVVNCVFGGTYDPDAWDMNLDPTLPPDTPVKVPGDRFDSNADQIELVQWSWAERARCHKSLGVASATATGTIALGWLVANEANHERPGAISNQDMTWIGYLVLLPAISDELRAVGPTRRYYTSAVIGTTLMSWRNNRMNDLLGALGGLEPRLGSGIGRPCVLSPAPTFTLSKADVPGIDTAQAKLITDLENYRLWCQSFIKVRPRIWALQARTPRLQKSFAEDRRLVWRQYANAVNIGGYEQRATTATVLHRIISLPLTLASNVVGGGATEYKLGDGRAHINVTDAATLPTVDVADLTLPAADPQDLAWAIMADLDAVKQLARTYIPADAAGKARQAVEDQALTDALNIAEDINSDAASLSLYSDSARELLKDIRALNAKRYLLLDVDAGGAYLTETSVSNVKNTGAAISPASAAATTPVTATGG